MKLRLPFSRKSSRPSPHAPRRECGSSIETLEARIAPATFVVTSPLDDLSGGTLRDAVNAANATTGPDTITFAPSAYATIALDPMKNAIAVTAPLTIKGPGMDKVTVSGAATTRAFFIDDGNVAFQSAVTLSGLTVIGGSGGTNGGAIYSEEPLTLTNVAVTGGKVNVNGGGLYVNTAGKVVITGSRFHLNEAGFNGGGLEVTATSFTMTKTLITDNEALGTFGGGVNLFVTEGAVKISNSVITGNKSANDGGGLAIFDSGLLVTVEKTTISGNSATDEGGGVFLRGGKFKFTGVTLHQNPADIGGGLSTGSAAVTLELAKSVVTRNVASSVTFGGGGVYFNTADPLTVTGTQFLGNEAYLGGAIYVQKSPAVSVSGSLFAGNHATLGGGAIDLEPNSKLVLKTSSFLANTSASSGGAISARGGGDLAISGGVFRQNEATSSGGAISVSGVAGQLIEVTGTLFQQNGAALGGAVALNGAMTAKIKGAKFIENFVEGAGDGGGLLIWGANSTVDVIGSLFVGNHAAFRGGGLAQVSMGAVVSVVGSQFYDNVSANLGGGIFLNNGTTTLSKIKAIGNGADNGGGIFLTAMGSATLTASTVTGNFAVVNPNTFGI